MAMACTNQPTPGKRGRMLGLMTRGRLDAFWWIHGIPILFLSQRLDTLTALMPSGECTGRATAARPGKKCCSRTTMSAPLTWRSIHRIRERFMPRCGIHDVHRGAFIRRLMDLGAEYSNLWMAATTGNSFRADSRRNE